MKRHVAILIFEDVEVLDFAGPFEVFALTDELSGHAFFHTFTVAESPGSIRARNGLKIVPDFTLESAPAPHVLIVPGGIGTRSAMKRAALLDWIRRCARSAEIVASVCTGALVLGRAGLLDGLPATTHYQTFPELRAAAPAAKVVEDVRFADNGKVVTAAGISAGLDMSLHLVARLHGVETAQKTAAHMEYHWSNDGGRRR